MMSHPVFNSRPKLPAQIWTDTPWHQDAQYYSDAKDVSHPVVSMWIPLQPAREATGTCMQLAGGWQAGSSGAPPLYEGWSDPETGFLGIEPAVQATLTAVSAEMDPGDLLCFHQLVPHRALPNTSGEVRWALDVRYEAAAGATEMSAAEGWVARGPQVLSREDWLAKWDDMPAGSY